MTLVLLHDELASVAIERVPEGEARHEDVLRDMLFGNPAMLPVRELEPGIGTLVPIARELVIADVGRIDLFLIDTLGRLIIVECKLWRNPQARREVIAQTLDYARALARFSYDDLQRTVSSSTKRSGNMLYAMAKEAGATIGEAAFVDRVSRDLAAGRFLLLIIGDGITEGTQRIAEYLQEQPGLAFTFGMVEMAEYRFHDPLVGRERTIVHPRLIARTVNLERIVIRSEAPNVVIEVERPAAAPTKRIAGGSSELSQQWRAFADRLIASIRFDDPGQPPPRNGGMGWLRVPLPGPADLTLWRSHPQQVVGAFARFAGADGLAAYELIASERVAIDAEFEEAALPTPIWKSDQSEGSLTLTWPAPLPWTEAAEAQQQLLLKQAANQYVNSLRPRLLALA